MAALRGFGHSPSVIRRGISSRFHGFQGFRQREQVYQDKARCFPDVVRVFVSLRLFFVHVVISNNTKVLSPLGQIRCQFSCLAELANASRKIFSRIELLGGHVEGFAKSGPGGVSMFGAPCMFSLSVDFRNILRNILRGCESNPLGCDVPKCPAVLQRVAVVCRETTYVIKWAEGLIVGAIKPCANAIMTTAAQKAYANFQGIQSGPNYIRAVTRSRLHKENGHRHMRCRAVRTINNEKSHG